MLSLKQVCSLADMSETTFAVWLSRGSFTPVSPHRPGRGTPSAFGATDAKHLCLVARLASMGVPVSAAEAVWRSCSTPADLHTPSSKVLVLLPGNRMQVYTSPDLALSDLPPVAVVVQIGALFAWVDAQLAIGAGA